MMFCLSFFIEPMAAYSAVYSVCEYVAVPVLSGLTGTLSFSCPNFSITDVLSV